MRIRGLSINGAGEGIKVIAASKLSVEDTTIDGFTDGISVASGTGQVAMANVTVIHNGTGDRSRGIVSLGNDVIHTNGKDGEPTSSVVRR